MPACNGGNYDCHPAIGHEPLCKLDQEPEHARAPPIQQIVKLAVTGAHHTDGPRG
jgi:hypothetical protein